jgi:hypothetical protein
MASFKRNDNDHRENVESQSDVIHRIFHEDEDDEDEDEDEDSHKPLIGNLEPVNIQNLTKINPIDLVVGKDYLIINNETNEKTRAKFRTFKVFRNVMGSYFLYYFKDKHGDLNIEGDRFFRPSDNNYAVSITQPYAEGLEFDENCSVFLPKTRNIMDKLEFKGLNQDTSRLPSKYLGGLRAKRTKRRKSASRHRRSIKNSKNTKARRRRK